MCHSCYYQLRFIARSLTFNALVSFVHAFVFSCIDYCSYTSLVSRGFGWRSRGGSTGLWCDILTGLRSLTTYPNICRMYCTGFHSHSAFHTGLLPWFWRCLSGWALSYLHELCRPLTSCAGRHALRASVHGNLVVPFTRSATMQTLSFSVVGPTTWNGLPIDLRHLPNGACKCSQFHHLLKTVLFRLACVGSASE